MIVVTTKAEYVNAIWVKNEWSRYLQLIDGKNGKTLIPAYKDMDPYDLPEEFSHLQALDMSKLGFMQDLIRGVHKIIKGNETIYKNETIVVNGGNANTVALLKRILLFLEDGEWSSAIEYAEKVLDMDPENGYAYFYELMAECKIHSENEIINQPQPIEGHKLYKKAIRFADNKLKNKLIEYNNQIIDRLAEEERRLKEEEREHLKCDSCKAICGASILECLP
ncbi:tetratricopeptide repeat protein, partial [Agathobacter sp.]|uniref:tetratricopeptide repeat protein n=1 Tax=Agathobacter sp. TaxID=2021311 RepID=UPI00280A5CB6